MKIWTRLAQYRVDPSRPLILALGNFDGVHVGHQEILKGVAKHAKKCGGVAAVLTFSEHPQRVLHPSKGPALLTSPQHRLFLFNEMGIELCFLLPFTQAFSKIDPESFVKDWLIGCLGAKEIHLGYNAHFGLDRKGDGQLIKKLSKQLNFDFYEIMPVKVNKEFVSSSLIRELITRGVLNQTELLLGRPFSLFASVVRGSGRGKSLGFPTANLQPHSEILPPHGVYPVELRENRFHLRPSSSRDEYEYVTEKPGRWWQGILNLGVRPTFEDSKKEIPEVHLFNFKGDLYEKTVEVRFHPRIREEKKFQNSLALVNAIKQDVLEAERYFSRKSLQKA